MPQFGDNFSERQSGDRLTGATLVTVVYETFAAACVAKDACRRLYTAGQLSEWRDSMWKFELLRLPGLRAEAAAEAAKADLVIVAFENHHALPAEVRQWLDLWQAHERRWPQLLLAAACIVTPLLAEGECDVMRELRSFARRVRCNFQPFPD